MIIAKIKKISDHVELHVIDIEVLTKEIIEQLDKNLVEICEGNSGTDIKLVKKKFLKFLETKEDKTKIGAVAEFFVHLYLRQCSYKQEFLFFNLEEGSIKKGFDGFFSKSTDQYLVESKSGWHTTIGISHKKKIKEAFDDISKVISGTSKKSSNNPWKNAYNHACHINVGTEKSIREKIKKISDQFDKNAFNKASEFNIIPCSSIFIKEDLITSLSNSIDDGFLVELDAKSLKAICITKYSYNSFINYLGCNHAKY